MKTNNILNMRAISGFLSLKTALCVMFAVVAISAAVISFMPSVTNAWWYDDTPSCLDCGGSTYGGDYGYGGSTLGGYGYTSDDCWDCYGGGYGYTPTYYPSYTSYYPTYYDSYYPSYGGYSTPSYYNNYTYDYYSYTYTPPACPAGTTGVYPNCVTPQCPSGTTGVFPNCYTPQCPTGTTGTYPNCVQLTCPTGTTGAWPNCVQLTCPTGTTGVYPNCSIPTCPAGTTGTYPVCVTLTCPSGTTGTYPNCTVPTCPVGTVGTFPNCTVQTCPAGTTGTFPNCVVIVQTPPSCSISSSPSSINQGSSSTLQWTTSNATSASIDQIGSVSVGSGSRSVSPSGTTHYMMTVTNSSGQSASCSTSIGVLPTPPTQNAPTCSMYINSYNNGNNGTNTGTLVWNSNNATSANITQIGNVGPNGSQQVYANTNNSTTYYGTFSGPGGTVNCTATFYVNTQPQTCDLRASSTNINQGQNLTLSWSAQNNASGFINGIGSVSAYGSQTVAPTSDTLYTATFNGPNGQSTCNVFVRVQAGQVAGVFLSQVPYTGFEAGPTLTVIFWLAVALFAAVIAYYIAGRGSLHMMFQHVAGAAGIPTGSHRADVHTEEIHESYPEMEEHQDSAYAASVVQAPRPFSNIGSAVSQITEPVAAAQSGMPEISDVIESRAHAAGVLMSPEAVSMGAALSENRAESLRAFGDILNEAVRTYPREDGWIMLTSDRFSEMKEKKGLQAPSVSISAPLPTIAEKTAVIAAAVTTAPLEKIDEASATEFVRAILSGNRDGAFSIVRSLEHDALNPTTLLTATATVLDRVYRAKSGTDSGADQSLIVLVQNMNPGDLHKLVEAFANALDASYANKYTGLKLALGQAFEIVG